jgi:hypothetical protein
LFFNEIKPAVAGFATLNMAGTLFINRASCAVAVSREGLIEVAKQGRVAGHSHEARARQAEKLRRHAAEVEAWSPSEQLGWLTVEVYLEKIHAHLAGITALANPQYAPLPRDAKGLLCLVRLLEQKGTHTIWRYTSMWSGRFDERGFIRAGTIPAGRHVVRATKGGQLALRV